MNADYDILNENGVLYTRNVEIGKKAGFKRFEYHGFQRVEGEYFNLISKNFIYVRNLKDAHKLINCWSQQRIEWAYYIVSQD
jgi:hypothetical protein